MKVTFYDILGIDPTLTDRDTPASQLFPANLASLTPGVQATGGNDDQLAIVKMLQDGLSFANIRPGVDGAVVVVTGRPAGQFSFCGDLHVTGSGLLTNNPLYLHSMPDTGIQLIPTQPGTPAQCFFAIDVRGWEVIIDRLFVRLFLKSGLAATLSSIAVANPPLQPSDKVDAFAVALQDDTATDSQPTEIDAVIRLHRTVQGDIILEPTVPLSLPACRFMGIPVTAIYDLLLIPSPNRRDYFEWARNDLGSFFSNPPVKGAIGFRSIDVDFSYAPFDALKQRIQGGTVNLGNLELVLEDVVVPLTVPGLPIPSHGTFGIRRKITDRTDVVNAYSLAKAPATVVLYSSPGQGSNGGTSLTLAVEKLLFATGSPPDLELQASLVWKLQSGTTIGATVGIDDDWTVFAGVVMPDNSPVKFTIADTTISLAGLKFGVSIGRLSRQIAFSDSYEILADLAIVSKPTGQSNSVFKMRSLTGKTLSVVLHDIGWKFGHFSMDGLQLPNGVQLIFANTIRIIIEELGWVEEPNGTPYFSFSGGIAIGFGGGDSVTPTSTPAQKQGDNSGDGVGIRVRRLRFRCNDDESQPAVKLDGIFLNLQYGPVGISGFGYITQDQDQGWAVNEFGFGVKVQFKALGATYLVAAEFIKGSRHEIANPSNEFSYFLAALTWGYMPAGPVGLYSIRLLLAYNMAPNLDAGFPDGEGMVLFKWYQDHEATAITMPRSRNLADWIPEKDSLALGVGCGFSFNGCGGVMVINIFIFFSKGNADTGLLIVGELYLLSAPKPIAFVAIEYDIDKEKFGIMIGVDLRLSDFYKNIPSWLDNVVTLSGTLYFGNQPWAFAIGQLADQRTWLTLKFDWSIFISVKFLFAVCVQIVDGGPKGFGLIVTLSAGSNWGIGSFLVWGSFGFIGGTWKTGSDTSGVETWITVGFKINLFFIFSFGCDATIKLTYIGKLPWYLTLSAEIRIDTPWFLPDVTFHVDKTWSNPLPYDTATLAQPLASAEGIAPAQQAGTLLKVPPLSDNRGDPTHVYTFNELNGVSAVPIANPTGVDIPIVSVDVTVGVNFTNPVSNDSAVATSTYTYSGATDAGVQKVQDMQLRYALKSISIRRSPRYGPTTGVWTDFITNADTTLGVGGVSPQTITFAWDADTRADGTLSPKRLLINSDSPYSFAIASPQNDEEANQNDPAFPCCDGRGVRGLYPKTHDLVFSGFSQGVRTPVPQQFTDNGAWWWWTLAPAPVVAPGTGTFVGALVARFTPGATGILGRVDFGGSVVWTQIDLAWEAIPGKILLEAYAGINLVGQASADLHQPGTTILSCQMSTGQVMSPNAGITRLVLRFALDDTRTVLFQPINPLGNTTFSTSGGYSKLAAVTVVNVEYITLADALAYLSATQLCGNGSKLGPPGSNVLGKLAFLPNHDYEVTVNNAVELTTKSQGARSLSVSQPFYFRTKGLPGLNAVPNTGDDLRVHVEGTYPTVATVPIYLEEPVALSFTEGMSSILPIDRAPLASDPPEKAQMFPLLLNVDRVISTSGMQRLTVPSDDWITAHRAAPPTIPHQVLIADPVIARTPVRAAPTQNPRVLRHLAVKAASASCGAQSNVYASQVLLHEPIAADDTPGPWEPRTAYRATVRQKDGPYAERSSFDDYDLGALIRQADQAASISFWSVDATGALLAPGKENGRHYLSCGELTWDHLQVHARINLQNAGAAAGIAIGVADGVPVPQGILALVEPAGAAHALVLIDIASQTELIRAAVTVAADFTLTVIAFDDNVRASVGAVVVEFPRCAVREGRVSFVADGPAQFSGIAVDALDMFTFEFRTTRFNSFVDHIDSYDGLLSTQTAGAIGSAPSNFATVWAAQGPSIAPVMAPSADPQRRQALFDLLLHSLGIGLRKNPLNMKLTRLRDASGLYGVLVESPDPLPIAAGSVTVSLTRQVKIWIPGTKFQPISPALPINIPPLFPIDPLRLSTLGPPTLDGLSYAQFNAGQVTLPAHFATYSKQTRIVRVVQFDNGQAVEVFQAPVASKTNIASGAISGPLLEIVPVARIPMRPDLKDAANLSIDEIGIIDLAGSLGGSWGGGHWVDSDQPVPLQPLSNGNETALLLLSENGVLLAGNYTMKWVIDRARWIASSNTDPEQKYHQEASIKFVL